MASTIGDLGNGLGYIYVTAPDGTTFISNIPNDETGARNVKSLGLKASSLGANIQAYGKIVVTGITGVGSVSAIDVGGINQIKTAISYTGATTVSELATDIADGITSETPSSGFNYTAISIGDTVYVLAPSAAGSTVNGSTVSVTASGNATFSTVNISGGTSSSDTYDAASGFRFFLNAASTATEGDLTGATEITDYLIFQGFNSGIKYQSVTISGGVATIAREANIQYVIIDTEGGAGSDDLDSIYPMGFADSDIIIIRTLNNSRDVTITNSGNIATYDGSTSCVLATRNECIALQYRASNGTFYELFRNNGAVPTASVFRAASYPFLSSSSYGKNTIAPADNTTVTLTANTSKQWIIVSGSATLSTGDYEIELSNTDAKAGDIIYITYEGGVTVGAHDVIIATDTLSDSEALNGGVNFICYFDGTGWNHIKSYSIDASKIETANIEDDAVTVAKVENNLTYEVLTFPVSFESGEQCDNKVKMPYPGTVTEVYAIATKAIAGTDAGTITPKNNAGTTMTSGVITFAASDSLNTAYTATPSANNTFAAGDILSFTTAKSTAGGKALVSVKVTRS